MKTTRKMSRTAIAVALLALTLGVVSSASADDAAVSADLAADLERAGGKLLQLAEAIPADKYSWRPTEEVRTTSEVFMHVVGTNFLLPPALGAEAPKGIEMPENPFSLMKEWEENVTSKEEVVKQLKASIDYATKALPMIPDHDAKTDLFGFEATKRAYMLIILTHVHEHLGQAIAYSRSMGVVPPWSAQAAGDGEG